MAPRPTSQADRRYEADMRLGWKLMAAAFQLVAELGAAILLGYGIDWYFGTSPRWTTVGAIFGVIFGLLNFVRTTIRLQGGWRTIAPASTPPKSPGGPSASSTPTARTTHPVHDDPGADDPRDRP